MITCEVWEADRSTRVASDADMVDAFDLSFRDPLNDVGEGGMSLPLWVVDPVSKVRNPLIDLIDYGMVVQMFVNGTPRFQWIVEQREIKRVARGEEHDEIVIYSGRGALALLETALVFPFGASDTPGYTARKPAPDERLFGVMSDEYDHTSWSFAEEIASQATGTAAWVTEDGSNAPAGWPSVADSVFWIWDAAADATDAPEGVVYFRALFSNPTTQQIAVYAAGDDLFTLYVDGVPLVGVDTDPLQWQTTRRAVITLSAGFHLIAAVAENRPGTPGSNPAGLLVALVEQDQYGNLGALLTGTNDLWLVLPRPADPPGVTAGTIVFKLWADAEQRDALPGVVCDFDGDVDSDGNAWDEIPTFGVAIGRTVLEALRMLSDAGHIDYAMDADSLTLRCWRGGERGSASGVILSPEVNVNELTFQGTG